MEIVNDFDTSVADVVLLMQQFLDRHITANEYRDRFIRLMPNRMEPHDEATSVIVQNAYGDADDFDSTVRLPYTIEEPELRMRVGRSLAELVRLGHSISR